MGFRVSVLIGVILVLISLPTFIDLLKPGILNVHDPVHYLRLYGFDQCLKDLQIPCRWVSDSGFGWVGGVLFLIYRARPLI